MSDKLTEAKVGEIFLVKRTIPDRLDYIADQLMEIFKQTNNLDIAAYALLCRMTSDELELDAKTND